VTVRGVGTLLFVGAVVAGATFWATRRTRPPAEVRTADELPPTPKPPPGPEASMPPASGPASQPTEYAVPRPPFSEGIFPCSQCHADQKTNPKRRVLTEEHTNIHLKHDVEHRWCLDCHNPDDRDYLRLASGEKVPFTESYRLCGQCHGDKYRDWRAGVHGRRTGQWNGHKTYLLCPHCHNPHEPRFKPLKPLPPPVRPEHLR